jgi:transposase
MEQASVIGIDLAKSVFQLEAQSGGGAVVWKKRLRRAAFIRFMERQAPRCLVGFEARGGAHYWGRFLSELGFPVKMMAPKAVKAYREGHTRTTAATPTRRPRRPAAPRFGRCG